MFLLYLTAHFASSSAGRTPGEIVLVTGAAACRFATVSLPRRLATGRRRLSIEENSPLARRRRRPHRAASTYPLR